MVVFASQGFSLFGGSVVGFALAWYLAKETGSATILATSMMVNFIPGIVLGPFIGPFIDRWNRKKIMIYSDLAAMLITAVLAVLFYTGTVQVWHVYVVIATRAAAGFFQSTALGASVSMIVPSKHLVRASGLSRSLQGAVNMIGPACGALLMKALPVQWVLSVEIIATVVSVGSLLPLGIPQPWRTTLTDNTMNVVGDMIQAFRYVASWRGLLFLIILCSMLNFFAGPLNPLLPLFDIRYLGGDVLKLGWLQAAFGVGAIGGGLILSAWGGFKRRILTSFVGLFIWSAAIGVFGFTTESLFSMGLAAMVVAGLGITAINAPVGAIIQATVAKDMQGRVFALVGSISGAMLLPSLAIAGPVVDAVGIRWVFHVSGAAMLILVLVGLFSRDVMNMENQKPADELAERAPS